MSESLGERLARVADRSTAELTHYGRRTGTPYRVTIWFAVDGDVIYLSTMNRGRQWTRNVLARRDVALETSGERFAGRVMQVTAEDEKRRAYEALVAKYWIMWLVDRFARLVGRDPRRAGMDAGRGGFYRVELADD